MTFEDILKAKTLLKDIIVETPTLYSPVFSKMSEAQVFLKLENLQETGSFKERGAYIKLKSLSEEALKRGVIAVSAGNHGQAVAFHAHNLGIPATIVMPSSTPPTKIANTEKWGAHVILAGDTLKQSLEIANTYMEQENLTFIHPYDDPEIIIGQATVGLEMLEVRPDLEILIVPIGGGGLCSGITLAAKQLNPNIKIYGVEVEGHASMAQCLFGSQNTQKESITLAEGIAVKDPGKLPQQILKDHLEDIIILNETEVEQAVECFLNLQHIIVEGAGAVGLSALFHSPHLFKGKNIGIIVSGGNIDPRLISSILTRGQVQQGRLVYFHLKVEDIPGTLERVASIIAQHQGNILEVKHQRLLHEVPIKMAELDIVVETRGLNHIQEIENDLKASGFIVEQLSDQFEKNRTF